MDIKNICFFGDSIAKGVVYDSENQKYKVSPTGFASLMSEKLHTLINNYAVFGCTVQAGLKRLGRYAEDLENCDLVMLEFGGNDCDHNWQAISDDPTGEHHPNLEPSEFESLYETMVTKLKALGKNVVMLNLPPIDAEKYFAWISRDRSAKNILNWLGGDEHYIYTWHEMYNKALSSVAKRQSVPLLDIRSAFLDRRDYADLICEDGIHPNEEGHKLIADTLLKACEESPFFGKVLA